MFQFIFYSYNPFETHIRKKYWHIVNRDMHVAYFKLGRHDRPTRKISYIGGYKKIKTIKTWTGIAW